MERVPGRVGGGIRKRSSAGGEVVSCAYFNKLALTAHQLLNPTRTVQDMGDSPIRSARKKNRRGRGENGQERAGADKERARADKAEVKKYSEQAHEKKRVSQ